MRALSIALLAALCVGCVTEGADGLIKQPPNLTEAAKANAQLAMEYMRNDKYELAQERAQRAVAQDSGVALAHAALAMVYARKGEDAEALKEYRRATALSPDDLAIRNNFAVFQCEHGQPLDAAETFASLARDKSYNTPASAWQNAGVCARRGGKLDSAESYFREALKLTPEDPETLLQLASVAAQQQQWLKVRAFIERRDRVAAPVVESLKLAISAERALGDTTAAARYERRLAKDFPPASP